MATIEQLIEALTMAIPPLWITVTLTIGAADAMAPCGLFADEIEKAIAGASPSGQTDSGVTARVFGSLLTWLNDHESGVVLR